MTRMITFVDTPNFLHSTFEVRTKSGIHSKMAQYGNYSFGGSRGRSWNGVVDRDSKNIFLFTAQKLRKKTKVVPLTKKHTKKTGANANKFKTEIVRHGHWEVRVFKIPLDRVISAGQGCRTFKVVVKG